MKSGPQPTHPQKHIHRYIWEGDGFRIWKVCRCGQYRNLKSYFGIDKEVVTKQDLGILEYEFRRSDYQKR